MNAVRGMAVILGFLLAGMAVSRFTGLPVPGNVLGMVLLAAGLGTGLVKLVWVREAADFLTKNLAFFFVPAGVGLMVYFDLLGRAWPVLLAATLPGTLAVVVLVGLFYGKLRKGRDRR